MARRYEFGPVLRRIRARRGWTQVQLAWTLGLTQPYVSMIEHGVSRPSLEVMAKIAAVAPEERETIRELAGMKEDAR